MKDIGVVSRREFLRGGLKDIALGLREAAGALQVLSGEDLWVGPDSRRPRPPGAIETKEFLARCTRCNECVKICPHQIIMKIVDARAEDYLTPILRSACPGCEDFPCVRACVPNALVMPQPPRQSA